MSAVPYAGGTPAVHTVDLNPRRECVTFPIQRSRRTGRVFSDAQNRTSIQAGQGFPGLPSEEDTERTATDPSLDRAESVLQSEVSDVSAERSESDRGHQRKGLYGHGSV